MPICRSYQVRCIQRICAAVPCCFEADDFGYVLGRLRPSIMQSPWTRLHRGALLIWHTILKSKRCRPLRPNAKRLPLTPSSKPPIVAFR